ncbi:glycosyltransferase [bacterium]|nr:glycosyltransferase [bacterium]
MTDTKRPRVSVVIPTWNRRDEIAITLDRLARAIAPGDEIIVVDNGSTDGTLGLLETHPLRPRLVRHEKNDPSAARNAGIDAAHAPFILMLDSDSHPEPGAIDEAARVLASHARMGAVAMRVLLAGGHDEPGGSRGVFIGCGAMLRAEALGEIGGYPRGFGYYAEEYDVCFRLAGAGWRVREATEAIVQHRRSLEGRDEAEILANLVRNNMRLYAAYLPADEAWRTIRWVVERYGRIAAEKGFAGAARRGKWRGLPRAMKGVAFGRTLPDTALAEISPERVAARLWRRLFPRGERDVVLWGVGKDFASIVRGARKNNVGLAGAIANAQQSYFACDIRVRGVPILHGDTLAAPPGPVVIASLSPGETRNERKALARLGFTGAVALLDKDD